MKKRLLIALSLTALIVVAVIPIHGLYYLHFTGAGNTTNELKEFLAALEWTREYERNEFDCSNMSARLCEKLREAGFRCVLAADNSHVWVLVRTKEGIQNIEATDLKVALMSETPWYVMHPYLSVLVAPLAGFGYEGDELAEKQIKDEAVGTKSEQESEQERYEHGMEVLRRILNLGLELGNTTAVSGDFH